MSPDQTTAAEAEPTIDTARLAGWMDAQGLSGTGTPTSSYISGGSQNEIYEIRRGDLHGALRIRPDRALLAR